LWNSALNTIIISEILEFHRKTAVEGTQIANIIRIHGDKHGTVKRVN
jgi:hypothetical protein